VASVLNSERAVKISIIIIQAFVRLREMVVAHKELALKFSELEGKVSKHDSDIQAIIQTLKQLIEPPPTKEKKIIGFGKG